MKRATHPSFCLFQPDFLPVSRHFHVYLSFSSCNFKTEARQAGSFNFASRRQLTFMHKGDHGKDELSRFQILKLFSNALFGLTCSELARNSGRENWKSRSFRASLATRLRRLRSSGLIRRKLGTLSRPAHSSRAGIYRWWITERGRQRLAWAKSQDLL